MYWNDYLLVNYYDNDYFNVVYNQVASVTFIVSTINIDTATTLQGQTIRLNKSSVDIPVSAEISDTVIRRTKSLVAMAEQTDVAVATVFITPSFAESADLAASVALNSNLIRSSILSPTIIETTDLASAAPAQKSSLQIPFDVVTTLVTNVNVLGAIEPVEIVNFVLYTCDSVQLVLHAVNEVNFTLH